MVADKVAFLLPALAGILAAEGARKVAPLVLPADFSRRRWANVAAVKPYLAKLAADANVVAFLRVIREGESGQDVTDYRRVQQARGVRHFPAPPWVHPGKPATGGSTPAAGAYQIMAGTWKRVSAALGLADFSPAEQDRAAIGLMAYRGALPAVLAGDLAAAFAALRDEWVSLPGASQAGKLTAERAAAVFAAYGGKRRATGK